jgi:polyisoprenoid-binding protein YceI
MSMTRATLLPCLCALLGAAASAQQAAPARLLPGSEIRFVSRQMGVPVEGRFTRFDAQVALDPKAPEGGRVALTVDTASAEFGAPELDAELPKPVWFDSRKFPQATFQSTQTKGLGGGRFEVRGTLDIKGVRRDVVIPVTLARSGDVSTASGSFVIRRLEFRIGDGEWSDVSMVADEVQVRFRLGLGGLAPP